MLSIVSLSVKSAYLVGEGRVGQSKGYGQGRELELTLLVVASAKARPRVGVGGNSEQVGALRMAACGLAKLDEGVLRARLRHHVGRQVASRHCRLLGLQLRLQLSLIRSCHRVDRAHGVLARRFLSHVTGGGRHTTPCGRNALERALVWGEPTYTRPSTAHPRRDFGQLCVK